MDQVILGMDPAHEEDEATRRQYPPGRGGSVCKRIRRTAKRYVVAWGLKRKRWPSGWDPKTRKHGWQIAGRS